MALYKSEIAGKNGVGQNMTKTYLVDEEGEKLCEEAFEDNPQEVKKRNEIETFKKMLRTGVKFYEIEKDESSPRFGKRVFDAPFSEEIEGTLDIALKELDKENAIKKDIEKELKKRIAEQDKKK